MSERARSRWHGMVAEMLLGACAWDRAAQFTTRLDLQAPLLNQSQTIVICGKLITVLRIWEGSSAELFFRCSPRSTMRTRRPVDLLLW